MVYCKASPIDPPPAPAVAPANVPVPAPAPGRLRMCCMGNCRGLGWAHERNWLNVGSGTRDDGRGFTDGFVAITGGCSIINCGIRGLIVVAGLRSNRPLVDLESSGLTTDCKFFPGLVVGGGPAAAASARDASSAFVKLKFIWLG